MKEIVGHKDIATTSIYIRGFIDEIIIKNVLNNLDLQEKKERKEKKDQKEPKDQLKKFSLVFLPKLNLNGASSNFQ